MYCSTPPWVAPMRILAQVFCHSKLYFEGGEMMGHRYFNNKAAVLIRRPYKCPLTLKALKCLYSANVLLTITEVYRPTPWGTRLEFTKSYNCSFHVRKSRSSILVNIGQFISRTFSLYNVYVIKNKTVVANFFGNTNVFK